MSSDATFERIAASLTHDKVAEVMEAFSLFDKDGDGEISVSELGTVLRSVGQTPTESDLRRLLREVDKDDSGTVDFAEFLLLMVKTPGIASESVKVAPDGPRWSGAPPDRSAGASGNAMVCEFSVEEMMEPFLKVDPSGSGWCARDDFVRIMMTQGDALTAEECAEMLESAIVVETPFSSPDSGAPSPPNMTFAARQESSVEDSSTPRRGSTSTTATTTAALTRPLSEYSLQAQLQRDPGFSRESSTALQIDQTGAHVNYRAFVTNLMYAAQFGSGLFD